jgi:hypothetical protein
MLEPRRAEVGSGIERVESAWLEDARPLEDLQRSPVRSRHCAWWYRSLRQEIEEIGVRRHQLPRHERLALADICGWADLANRWVLPKSVMREMPVVVVVSRTMANGS